ncbi:hypothetical protein [Aquibacillus sediminis]|uniref:hypothetical protein n=1 Tax=Aquibacillus sediminis TaxID=2574734 RepID=UPI001108222D|nr:hypothetical protein [Aquibacillus sediminis]
MDVSYSRSRAHGDPTLWSTLEVRNGFKLQQHDYIDYYRILDPEEYRVDIGLDEQSMLNSFLEIAEQHDRLH